MSNEKSHEQQLKLRAWQRNESEVADVLTFVMTTVEKNMADSARIITIQTRWTLPQNTMRL